MSHTPTTRPPPEIIFVPPGQLSFRTLYLTLIVGVAVLAFLMLVTFPTGGPRPAVLSMIGAFALTFGLVVGLKTRSARRAIRKLQHEFDAKHPDASSDPRAVALATVLKPDRLPKLSDVRRALADHPCPDRARIVCYGIPEVPDVGEIHFEPEIITGTDMSWRQLALVPVALALVALWLLDYVNWLPTWFPTLGPMMRGMGFFYVAGAVGIGIWAWKTAVRPTYIRMAPGIVQVLVFHWRRTKPTIRSYPMEAGTLAIMARYQRSDVLFLIREAHHDRLPFGQLRARKLRQERAWHALLSTAPTPPLSDETLLG